MGCERCRLWGKLQFLGLGTAMKILFADEGPGGPQIGQLSRNEVVALLNVLHRLSMSLSAISVMRDLEAQRALHTTLVRGVATLAAVLAALFVLRWRIAPPPAKAGGATGNAGKTGSAGSAASAAPASATGDSSDGVVARVQARAEAAPAAGEKQQHAPGQVTRARDDDHLDDGAAPSPSGSGSKSRRRKRD